MAFCGSRWIDHRENYTEWVKGRGDLLHFVLHDEERKDDEEGGGSRDWTIVWYWGDDHNGGRIAIDDGVARHHHQQWDTIRCSVFLILAEV